MSDTEQLFSREWQNKNIERGVETMKKITAEVGLQATTLAELALTPEEMKKLLYIQKITEPNVHCYSADRQDGTKARVLIRPTGQGDFAAEVFSPAFYGGHGSNHDFNEGDLKGTLTTALNSSVYPN